MFRVSDKVVCVEFFHVLTGWSAPDGLPIKGGVYVVRDIFPSNPDDGLILVGIRGIRVSTGVDEGFNYRGFRKLDEIKKENRLKNHDRERTPEKVS